MVVPEDGRLQLDWIGEVTTPGAQVATGREGGVVDAVRAGDTVAVAIDAIAAPAGGNELHRTHCAVPDRILIQHSAIGVGNGGYTRRSVQRGTQDRSEGVTGGIDPAAPGVARLDPSNPGQHGPRQVAARPGGHQIPLGRLVRAEHDGRDPQRSVRQVRWSGKPGRFGSAGVARCPVGG
jgi:hypothetical protein